MTTVVFLLPRLRLQLGNRHVLGLRPGAPGGQREHKGQEEAG
jgi:hypothetical protein